MESAPQKVHKVTEAVTMRGITEVWSYCQREWYHFGASVEEARVGQGCVERAPLPAAFDFAIVLAFLRLSPQAQALQLIHQRPLHFCLMFRRQLLSPRSQIKRINCHLSLSIDQSDLNIALLLR
jgi:hypothetical protein